MSAQFAEQPADPRVAAIPRTIGAIRDAMPDETRRREAIWPLDDLRRGLASVGLPEAPS